MCSSPNFVSVIKSRKMRWTEHVERMWDRRGVYGVLVGKPEGKRPLGRLRRGRIQGGSNMTGTDFCVNKAHCAAAVRP